MVSQSGWVLLANTYDPVSSKHGCWGWLTQFLSPLTVFKHQMSSPNVFLTEIQKRQEHRSINFPQLESTALMQAWKISCYSRWQLDQKWVSTKERWIFLTTPNPTFSAKTDKKKQDMHRQIRNLWHTKTYTHTHQPLRKMHVQLLRGRRQLTQLEHILLKSFTHTLL